jgi:hypothetical protein
VIRAARYHPGVSGCADHFKEATRREAAAMSPGERVERALALGQSDLELYAAVSGLGLDEARADLRRRREQARSLVVRTPEP